MFKQQDEFLKFMVESSNNEFLLKDIETKFNKISVTNVLVLMKSLIERKLVDHIPITSDKNFLVYCVSEQGYVYYSDLIKKQEQVRQDNFKLYFLYPLTIIIIGTVITVISDLLIDNVINNQKDKCNCNCNYNLIDNK